MLISKFSPFGIQSVDVGFYDVQSGDVQSGQCSVRAMFSPCNVQSGQFSIRRYSFRRCSVRAMFSPGNVQSGDVHSGDVQSGQCSVRRCRVRGFRAVKAGDVQSVNHNNGHPRGRSGRPLATCRTIEFPPSGWTAARPRQVEYNRPLPLTCMAPPPWLPWLPVTHPGNYPRYSIIFNTCPQNTGIPFPTCSQIVGIPSNICPKKIYV